MFNKIKYFLPVAFSSYFLYWFLLIYGYCILLINYKEYSQMKFGIVLSILVISTFLATYLGKIFLKNKILIGRFKDLKHVIPIFAVTLLSFYTIDNTTTVGWFLLLCLFPLNYIYLHFLPELINEFVCPIHINKWKVIVSFKSKDCYILLKSKSFKCIYHADGVFINNYFISMNNVINIEDEIGKSLWQLNDSDLEVVEMYNY